MQSTIRNYLPGIIILALCIFLSLYTYKDIGMGWDESVQRDIGTISYNYMVHDDHTLDTYEHREYGTGFEVPLIAIEKAYGLQDVRDIYLMRHLVSHLLFLLACFSGYMLCYRLFRNNVIACIGFLLFVFHPRIFGHSFINSKDVPFLSMFLISLAVCQLAFDKNRTSWYLLLGITCGYTTSIRITGIILVCIICFFLIVDLIHAFYKKEKVGQQFINLFVFITATCLALYATFPTLWASPLSSFADIFKSLSHYRWTSTVLLNSKDISAAALPWYYLPVWFCITTPVLWLLAGFAGMILIISGSVRRPMEYLLNTRNRNFIIYLSCFILPVVAIIVLRSVVYDDWRHVYFIYPAFVLMVLYAVDKAYKSRWKMIVPAAFVLQFAGVGYFMVKYYPYQHVYFNELVSHKPEFLHYNYDMDYWGCSYRQGLEYILANDPSSEIGIYTPVHEILIHNALAMQPAAVRSRVIIEDRQHADYMITNFRLHTAEYDYPVYYDVKVLNSTILKVYKLK